MGSPSRLSLLKSINKVKEILSFISKLHQLHSLLNFFNLYGIEFSQEEFNAMSRRCHAKNQMVLSYKEIMRLFSPFEPFNFPTYRKQNNFQKALEYINQEVAKL